MKKIISLLLCIFLLVSVFALSANAAESKEVQIVFTHDMHSYIDTAKNDTGGFARVKTIIDTAISEDPCTFVLDGGDFSMGTLYQSIYSSQATELRLLGFMGYDATTLGNHEFDYGSNGLAEMLQSAQNSGDKLPQVLSCNINWDSSTGEYTQMLHDTMDNFGVKEYTVIEKDGVKAAIFGLMGKDADECAPNSGLKFDAIAESAAKTVSEINKNEDVDIVICLSHSGTGEDEKSSEDVQLAKAVPGIDFIISGHSHTKLEKPIVIGNTTIVSSGEYAKNVGKARLQCDSSGNWSVKTYDLIPTDSSVSSDEATLEKISEFKALTQSYLNQFGYNSADQVIAYSPFDMASLDSIYNDHTELGLGYLITDAYIYAVKQAEGENYVPIDMAVVPSGVIRSTFLTGNITVSDAYEVSSLGMGKDRVPGYPLISIYLTGKELKTAAEIDASVSNIMTSARLFCSGMQYTFNPNRLLLNRITDVALTKEGERAEIEDDKLYRVVADYYSGQMLGAVKDKSFNLLSLEPKDENGKAIDSFDNRIIYNGNQELKAWYALSSYLESFDKQNGVPTIPEIYNTPQGRKNIDSSKNIIDIIKNPNKIAFIALGAALIIILILVLIVVAIVKIVKKIKKKKAANSK